MPFNPAKPFGEKFSPDNDTQAGFLSLFADFALSENPPTGEDLIAEIKDAMTPMYLVDPEICKKLPIYGKVKAFLERFDVQVPVTEESGSLVAKRLICRIWNEEEFENDRAEAFAAFADFRNGGRNSASSPRQYVPFNSTDETAHVENSRVSTRQISNDVAKRFSHEKLKFSGESTECWPKFVESYTRMSVEMELSDEMKRKFFHHLLRDHALEFYRDNVENSVEDYKEILLCMNKEFCSKVKMEAIARKLQSLHISQFEKDDKTEEEALREMAKEIQNLTPQAPLECRTDRFRKNILYTSTQGREWALHISSSTNFLNLSYQQLLHELHNSLQQHNIHNSFGKIEEDNVFRSNRISETNFTGQGTYAKYKPNVGMGRRQIQNRLMRCWNCGKPNCSVSKCPHPKNAKKIRLNRIKHFEAKKGRLNSGIAEALFQFSEEYIEEDDTGSNSDNQEENTDVEDDNSAAEVQHVLADKIHQHLNNSNDDLDF